MADLVLGPSGGNGGHEFSGYTIPAGAKLREIHVNAGFYVDGLQLVYSGADGVLIEMPHIGGRGGLHHTIKLDADEYLVGISGRCGRYVDSIRFHTNKRTTDRYGGHGGDDEYHYEAAADGEVAGLFGRAAWFVDQIGVIVRGRGAAWLSEAGTGGGEAAAVSAAAPTSEVITATEIAAVGDAAAVTEVAPDDLAAAGDEGAFKGAAPVTELVGLPDSGPVEPPAPDLIAMPEPGFVAPPAPTLIGIPDSGPVEATAPELVGIPDSEPIAVESAAQVTGLRTETVDLNLSVVEDDLTRIEGIGPKMAQVLGEAGITTFAQLADASPARLREILDAAGNRYRMIDPTTWPQQAALAAAGDWSGFNALAAQLKGGRKG